MTERLGNECVYKWAGKREREGSTQKATGTTSDIYNASWSRRTKAFISSSGVPQINRCGKWKWQKRKRFQSGDIWKVAYLSPKREQKTETSTLFQQTETDTLSFAPSHMHTFVYAIAATDGISYQQSFHVAVLLYLRVAVCSVFYLFHHLIGSIRKHISHSKWHQEQFKTKAGSVCRLIMWSVQQATDKVEAWGKREVYFIFVCPADVLGIKKINTTIYKQIYYKTDNCIWQLSAYKHRSIQLKFVSYPVTWNFLLTKAWTE